MLPPALPFLLPGVRLSVWFAALLQFSRALWRTFPRGYHPSTRSPHCLRRTDLSICCRSKFVGSCSRRDLWCNDRRSSYNIFPCILCGCGLFCTAGTSIAGLPQRCCSRSRCDLAGLWQTSLASTAYATKSSRTSLGDHCHRIVLAAPICNSLQIAAEQYLEAVWIAAALLQLLARHELRQSNA